MNRWRIYLRERFPLAQHAPLVLVFSFCAVSYSAHLRGAVPSFGAVITAFIVCLLAFLHLRLADEFKDAEEDRHYRPSRPVPCGLVKLRELACLWIGTATLQLIATLWHEPGLVLLLAVAWTYLGLMSVEFFARTWLKARPLWYLLSHMGIMPLVDLFATGCDWWSVGTWPGPGLGWFLAASFSNGIVIEMGRKLWTPDAEMEGVETYSKRWGRRAPFVWASMVALTGLLATVAAAFLGLEVLLGTMAFLLTTAAFQRAYVFSRRPERQIQRWFEPLSALTTLVLYGCLGLAPFIY